MNGLRDMNNVNKAKLRASFITYLKLKNKPIRLSEYMDFLNTLDLGLGKSVSIDEMSYLINRDSFTKNIMKKKTNRGYIYSIKE